MFESKIYHDEVLQESKRKIFLFNQCFYRLKQLIIEHKNIAKPQKQFINYVDIIIISIIKNFKQQMKQQKLNQGNIGLDIIQFYKPYIRPQSKWIKTKSHGCDFELPQNFQIKELRHCSSSKAFAICSYKKQPNAKPHYVLVKKIINCFDHKKKTKRMLRKLKLLRLINHENINNLKKIILPRSRQQFNQLYLVFDFLQSDIKSLITLNIKSTQQYQKQLIYDLIKSILYIHTSNVVHRNLRPNNILISNFCHLQISNFSLARRIEQTQDNDIDLNDYTISLWYRSPQMLLGDIKNDKSIDIWSIGCIIWQIIMKKPLFKGINNLTQLECIHDHLSDVELKKFIDLVKQKIRSKQWNKIYSSLLSKKKMVYEGCSLTKQLMKKSPIAADLVRKMLVVNPKQRITIQQILQHPFFKQIRNKSEQKSSQPLNPMEFQFQKYDFTNQQYKDMIYEEILLYHFPAFKEEYFRKIQAKQSVISHIRNNSNSTLTHPDTDDYD